MRRTELQEAPGQAGILSPARFLEDYVVAQAPVVLRRSVGSWPAIDRWTDEYLTEVASDVRLEVRPKVDYSGGESQRETEPVTVVELPDLLAELAGEKISGDLCYAREMPLLDLAPSLRSDVIEPIYLRESFPHLAPKTGHPGPSVWIGPSGTVAQLHWDPEHNLFAQVRGRKTVLLVAPQEYRCLYQNRFSESELSKRRFFQKHRRILNCIRDAKWRARRDGQIDASVFRSGVRRTLGEDGLALLCDFLLDVNNCHVDADNPDLAAHPRFGSVDVLHVVLAPGDLLFIPAFWFHRIESLDASISLNWFFMPEDPRFHPDQQLRSEILLDHLVP